jgi:hypothetical protein
VEKRGCLEQEYILQTPEYSAKYKSIFDGTIGDEIAIADVDLETSLEASR